MHTGNINTIINDCSEVHDFTNNGECSGCGNCCSRYLPLSQHEINTIIAYVKRKNIKQQFHSVNVLSERFFDMCCPFLDDTKPDKKCTIYEVRPLICRDFNCKKYIDKEKPCIALYSVPRKKVDVTETFFGDKG